MQSKCKCRPMITYDHPECCHASACMWCIYCSPEHNNCYPKQVGQLSRRIGGGMSEFEMNRWRQGYLDGLWRCISEQQGPLWRLTGNSWNRGFDYGFWRGVLVEGAD